GGLARGPAGVGVRGRVPPGGAACGADVVAVPAARWERFEAFLWETTSLLVLGEGESLVVDPAITAEEVAAISARAVELGAPVRQVLITHGDWDHVCGIGGGPAAVVAVGAGAGGEGAARAGPRAGPRAARGG